ncbi:hypothetical protein [Citricoccus sp. I39-566]|uniref:hypothetical protein n=1 Tax=Citricoccus sp. I39-566 TaxID=3073268 RepID=UPI00286C9885|nr:hypothetical protein [Citricoccus sp. I39-566]WMY77867.1 hypothetical protein RE421_13720 [Citricoccus sp. I39-566]
MLNSRVLRVLIAAPGDCQEERDGMVKELHAWNVSYAESTGIYLWPWRWEENSYATYGLSGQETLNEQLVSKADMCVAFFRKKLGTPTDDYDSGTVEEIERSAARGLKPAVHFLDDGSRPPYEEEGRLVKFKKSLETRKFYYMPYKTHVDGVRLAMVAVRARVDYFLKKELAAAEAESAPAPTSELAATSTPETASTSRRPAPGSPYADSILHVAQRGGRRIVDMVSGMQGLVRHDWKAEVSDFGNGWEIKNTSGLPVELRRYRVLEEPSGSSNGEVWAKGVPAKTIRPNEPFLIADPYDRPERELSQANIRVEYVAEDVFLEGVVPMETYMEVADDDGVEAGETA